jgi:hypothetical protein
MVRSLHVVIAALGAAGALGGCVEEPMTGAVPVGPGVYAALTGAELQTVGAPGPADLPFGEGLVAFSRELGAIHAADGPRADVRIRRAIQELAVILERMPAAAAQPSLRWASGAMLSTDASFAGEEAEGASIEGAKRSLAIAATALQNLAAGCYRRDPEIAARTRAFAGAVNAIDPTRAPPDRPGVINALVRAERALATMYAANVAPSKP